MTTVIETVDAPDRSAQEQTPYTLTLGDMVQGNFRNDRDDPDFDPLTDQVSDT
ncbi:hypothetical protein [Pseudaestuariivita sp.]|uniref:hypothetical protein n=1 Tax=Pseudaestuariivita sp. TaxID=2211669 RepID=UPI004059EF05